MITYTELFLMLWAIAATLIAIYFSERLNSCKRFVQFLLETPDAYADIRSRIARQRKETA